MNIIAYNEYTHTLQTLVNRCLYFTPHLNYVFYDNNPRITTHRLYNEQAAKVLTVFKDPKMMQARAPHKLKKKQQLGAILSDGSQQSFRPAHAG